MRRSEDGVRIRSDQSSVGVQAIECTALGKCFESALIQCLGIDAGGKVRKGCILPVGISLADDRLDGAGADILQGGERISDGAKFRITQGWLDAEIDT